MHVLATAFLLSMPAVLTRATSSKRGLVYVDSEYTSDDNIWDASDSELSWYYNYGASPTTTFDHTNLEFVPMCWGSNSYADGFYESVKGLIDSGMIINYVLGFNEPDGCSGGGSCINPKTAVTTWMKEIEPLKELGVKLGAPAVTGSSSGVSWLQKFYDQCAGKCTTHFLPIHWYGDFEGLASYVGGINVTYENMTMWVTEFANANVTLLDTQEFFNQSVGFLDGLSYVTHYSYFGAFRSDVSNIGPNAAMLNQAGDLTDIGAWYLGLKATGNLPKSGSSQQTTPLMWPILAILAASLTVAL